MRDEFKMQMLGYHSRRQVKYHVDLNCRLGKSITDDNLIIGTGGYPKCEFCKEPVGLKKFLLKEDFQRDE